mgnify:CR=1 FL=1
MIILNLKLLRQVIESSVNMFNSVMLAVTFALSFALMFLGVIVLFHFETWIGLAMIIIGSLRFFKDLHYN